jgi:integrase/recombinase XerD
VSPQPAPPPDLAGRWLSKFFTDHLAGERAASPKTTSSYRDAMKLLLTWFRDTERIPPEKLRLADIDRPRILRFLDWLEAGRNCSVSTRNQRLAVIKSFCRYTAVEQPDRLGQVTQVLAIRQKKTPAPQLEHLTGDEVKMLLAEPGTASARAVRDTVLLALAYDTAARVQELCDLDVADIRRGSPMTVVIRGKGSKIRYVPVMDPTARLVGDYLGHRDRHPGVGADADPLFAGPNHSRLTRSGVAKLLARHVRSVRARDPGWAPGLPVTPHTLRRSRAMHLVQAGVNLIYIRDLLGHADVSTTEIYARYRRRDQTQGDRKCLRAAHPRRLAGLDPRLVADRLARLARALTPARAQHYADYNTSSAAPSSGNATAGRITQPSA